MTSSIFALFALLYAVRLVYGWRNDRRMDRAGLGQCGWLSYRGISRPSRFNVKRLELLREAFPRLARIGVLYEARQTKTMIPPIEVGARSLRLSLTRLEVRGADEIEPAFILALRERVDTVMPVSSALFDAEKQRLVSLAAKHRLPTMYEHRAFPQVGGL